ncbi:MAG: hypothetical protein QM762_15805 [Chryseolinea sp.]
MNVQLFPLILSASMAITSALDLPGAVIVAYPNVNATSSVRELPCANDAR